MDLIATESLRRRLESAVSGDAPSDLSAAQLIMRFMAHAERYYAQRKGSTELANFREATATALLLYSDIPGADFGPVQLRAVRQLMIERNLARSTINARVRRIRQVWRWGVSMGWIPPDTLARLDAIQGLRRGRSQARETEPVHPVPLEVIARTLAVCPSTVSAMAQVQLLTAARPGEVVICRGVDLDTSGSVWLYRPTMHKNKWRAQDRLIAIGPKARAIIEPRLSPGFIFPTPSGTAYTVNTYAQSIARACRRAGVDRWSPNRLRHTAASLIRREHGMEAASCALGHARLETSAIYAAKNDTLAREVALRYG